MIGFVAADESLLVIDDVMLDWFLVRLLDLINAGCYYLAVVYAWFNLECESARFQVVSVEKYFLTKVFCCGC